MDASKLQLGNFTTTLAGLYSKGMRYNTVIDIGCADGQFFLDHYMTGLFLDTKPLNIDANSLYEKSLQEIQDVLGGAYAIAAVADKAGEIEFTNSVHPYWSSIRPPDDLYWTRVNSLHSEAIKIKARTLDEIIESSQLPGPYLLKMDIQGAEERAIKGAAQTLSKTDVVIVEADIADFQAIHAALTSADFSLYDITNPNWLTDASLGWFYPVYLNNRRSDMKPSAFWKKEHDAGVIEQQVQRRRMILQSNAQKLQQLRAIKLKK
jgi:FkbM family methyltransferase